MKPLAIFIFLRGIRLAEKLDSSGLWKFRNPLASLSRTAG